MKSTYKIEVERRESDAVFKHLLFFFKSVLYKDFEEIKVKEAILLSYGIEGLKVRDRQSKILIRVLR